MSRDRDRDLDALLGTVPESEPRQEGPPSDAELREVACGREDPALDARVTDNPTARRKLARIGVEEHLARFGERTLRETAERRRRVQRLRWIGGGAVAAAAAAAALAVVAGPSDRPPLPPYDLEGPTGGVAETRGGSTSEEFLPDSRLSAVLRPAEELASEEVTLRVVVARADDPNAALLHAPRDSVTEGEGGVFRFSVRAGDLFTEAGDYDLYFLISRTADTGSIERATSVAELAGLPPHASARARIHYASGVPSSQDGRP